MVSRHMDRYEQAKRLAAIRITARSATRQSPACSIIWNKMWLSAGLARQILFQPVDMVVAINDGGLPYQRPKQG